MISEAPIEAAKPLVTLGDKVKAYVAVARLKAADGLSIAELSELIVSAMRMAIAALDSIPVDGVERKAIVIAFVGDIFDEFADRVVPLPAWPVWIIAKPTVRIIALAIAAGATEALLPLVRSA
jgi:hypothetical protein